SYRTDGRHHCEGSTVFVEADLESDTKLTQSQRARARFTPVNLATHFKSLSGYERDAPPVNRRAHKQQHRPHELIYTSTKTITTSAGTPLYPVLPGRLVAVRVSVATAPTSALTCDVLL